jgi:nitrate/nitrite transport system substrate-binding protein
MAKFANRERSTRDGTLRDEVHSGITRRRFLSGSAKGIGISALLSGLPTGWVGSVFANDAPETSDLKIGIIALTDCSTIVIAHEKGLFKSMGSIQW